MNATLAQFHYLRPGWLLALLALPLLLWLWRRRRIVNDPWRQVCDAHLLPHLLDRGGGSRGWLAPVLFSLGFVIAINALAGPAFRQLPQPLSRADSALIVALDLSDTMRATDLKPDRATRARFKLARLLAARREGQTALIAYAGDAFTVAPLTDDANSLEDLANAMQSDIVPVRGKRAERAIDLAVRLLHDAGFETGDLLLITDAVDRRAIDGARRASAAGLRVSALGAGTLQGAPAPLPDGGFMPDDSGGILLAKLDDASLRMLADSGGGRYAALASDNADLAALGLDSIVGSGARLSEDERTTAAYRDEGPWLLLALLPLAALAFRRGWLACLALMFALPTPPAHAFEWDALWKRDDQRAWEALQADPARAQQLAKDSALRGSAAYRAEDYAGAEQDFAKRSDADAHYNRGNALAKVARYEEALAAYDEALKAVPGMDDAQANRKAVEDWLKQQQQQQSEQQQQQQGGDSSQQQQGDKGEQQEQQGGPQQQQGEQQESQSSESKDGQAQQREGGEQDQAQDGTPQDAASEQQKREAEQRFAEQMEQALKDGEQGEADAAAAEEDPGEAEKRQAAEQWLRRVPDDPGGLLRRKFALEYQRRQREGEGR